VIEKQKQEYSVKTLAHLRNLMSTILGTAESWGWLQDNAAHGVKLPPAERVRETRVLTVAEIAKLREGLREPVRTMFILALGLGLRIGELLPLRSGDLDLEAGVLYVRRGYYRGHLQQTPKTKRSERCFKLPAFLADTLKGYLSGIEGCSFRLACLASHVLHNRGEQQSAGLGRSIAPGAHQPLYDPAVRARARRL
jgi:integrase